MTSHLGLFLALGIPALLVTQWLLPLYRNYRIAQKTGLPIVFSPVDSHNIFFLFLKIPLWRYVKKLIPTDGIRVAEFGWQFLNRRDSVHRRRGKAFIVVSPGSNELWCADPDMSQMILARRKDFMQSQMVVKMMSFQGENILASNGDSWGRQRRLVAPNLNERISTAVWTESLQQANDMADYMLAQQDSSSRDVVASTKAIAINVLGKVGYGQPKPFKPVESLHDPQKEMTYVDAIGLVVDYIMPSALVPTWLLRLPFMPPLLQTIAAAKQQLPGLTSDMLQAERKRAALKGDAQDNMMSMLVKLSDAEKTAHGGQAGQYLKDEEIAGNLFVFTAAGYDTTANTLSFAITLLAAHPKWQEWIQEEIDLVWKDIKANDEPPDYTMVYPRLNRVLAVMFETLRVLPPLLQLARSTGESQDFTMNGKPCCLEGGWRVFINIVDLHIDPDSWGEDALDFRPSRWITPESTLGDSHLITPTRGTFCPWSGGPRVCPGMKMSQVEFVAVVSTLFRKFRVDPVVQPGRDLGQARSRLIDVAFDSMQSLSTTMNNPKEVNLKWNCR